MFPGAQREGWGWGGVSRHLSSPALTSSSLLIFTLIGGVASGLGRLIAEEADISDAISDRGRRRRRRTHNHSYAQSEDE